MSIEDHLRRFLNEQTSRVQPIEVDHTSTRPLSRNFPFRLLRKNELFTYIPFSSSPIMYAYAYAYQLPFQTLSLSRSPKIPPALQSSLRLATLRSFAFLQITSRVARGERERALSHLGTPRAHGKCEEVVFVLRSAARRSNCSWWLRWLFESGFLERREACS